MLLIRRLYTCTTLTSINMRLTVVMIEQWSNATDMLTILVNNVDQNQPIEQWSNAATDMLTI